MRLALLSDVHGNTIALDAVLADIDQAGGVDEFWVLGDLVALGPDPVGALERLVALPNVSFLRGNTDRYLTPAEFPFPTAADVQADPGLLDQIVETAATFAWTQGFVTAAGWFDWLVDLPIELRRTLPDGTRLLGVHSSPGRDDGPGIGAHVPEADLEAAAAAADADVVCVGHTHIPFDRTVKGVRLFNLGSVSNPPLGHDRRASYAVLEAGDDAYELSHRRVDYDHDAVIDAVRSIRHPSAEFIIAPQRDQ